MSEKMWTRVELEAEIRRLETMAKDAAHAIDRPTIERAIARLRGWLEEEGEAAMRALVQDAERLARRPARGEGRA